jgi:hypothetical protein
MYWKLQFFKELLKLINMREFFIWKLLFNLFNMLDNFMVLFFEGFLLNEIYNIGKFINIILLIIYYAFLIGKLKFFGKLRY